MMQYTWTNLESGNSGVSDFTVAQHWMFGKPDDHPARALQKAIDFTLKKWNLQQPKVWRYQQKTA